jgi:hypothetical protein
MTAYDAVPFVSLAPLVCCVIYANASLLHMSRNFEQRASIADQQRFLSDYVDFKLVQSWTLFHRDFKAVCDQDSALKSARRHAIRAIATVPISLAVCAVVFIIVRLNLD